jgi:hypothetical protein
MTYIFASGHFSIIALAIGADMQVLTDLHLNVRNMAAMRDFRHVSAKAQYARDLATFGHGREVL